MNFWHRPVECETFKPQKAIFWSYYLEDHYKQPLPGINTRPMVVTNEVIKFMISQESHKDKKLITGNQKETI